jgi:hypothetical protein
MGPEYHQSLLAAAQSGCLDQLTAEAEAFAARHEPGDFGRAAHAKSGDAVLHVLARGGHVHCIRFLLESYSGREHVDIEIRYWYFTLCITVRKT